MAMQEAMYGQESAQYAASLYTLATSHASMGHMEEAEALFRRVLSILGPGVHYNAHNLVASCHISLAGMLLSQERDEEALTLLSEAVGMLGTTHPDAAPAMGAYATALLKARREEEALDMATQALNLRTRNGALVDAPECVNLLLVVGHIHRMREEMRQAEEMVRMSLGMAERVFGAESPYTARVMQALSECLRTEPGCFTEAEELGRKAREILSKSEQQGGGEGPPSPDDQ
ncbi:hypothetical protein JKP88DRAFT_71082 [Tribonema minus]|uniref:Kinesin light chain n=1 Tax=Tribonema minus TaxID=303371 RepID=A0A835YU06_9STRA|nr:hypothetical protein JKP88DRAFT_71082 [Tribonema minus]